MKVKKHTAILFLIISFACSKKNNNEPDPTPSAGENDTGCVLNNYVGVKNGAIIVSEYKYNQQGKISEEIIMIPNDVQYVKKIYNYDDQKKRIKLITEFYAKDELKDPFKLTQTINRIYEYDVQGRFIKATDLHGSNPTLNAEYNNQNQLYKITGNIEGENYLFLTYDENGDVIKVERVSQANPTIRLTIAQFEYDASLPAKILPEQMDALHGLDFLVQNHLCKRAYYFNEKGEQTYYTDFIIYKRSDIGQPDWDWVDVKSSNNISRTYSLDYECK